jgi:probable rRNA maturation factor
MAEMDENDAGASVDFRGLPVRYGLLRPAFEEAARRILADHGVDTYEISISFVDNDEMTKLNEERLGRSGPTDVIAFDLSEPGFPFEKVGDIYICTDTALENSARFNVSHEQELLRLVVHGVLHVLGYTDLDATEASRMERIQEEVVKDFQLLADGDEE